MLSGSALVEFYCWIKRKVGKGGGEGARYKPSSPQFYKLNLCPMVQAYVAVVRRLQKGEPNLLLYS